MEIPNKTPINILNINIKKESTCIVSEVLKKNKDFSYIDKHLLELESSILEKIQIIHGHKLSSVTLKNHSNRALNGYYELYKTFEDRLEFISLQIDMLYKTNNITILISSYCLLCKFINQIKDE